jgi:hypothetical protein
MASFSLSTTKPLTLIPSLVEMFVALESTDHFHIDKHSMIGGDKNTHLIEEGLSRKGPINLNSKSLRWKNKAGVAGIKLVTIEAVLGTKTKQYLIDIATKSSFKVSYHQCMVNNGGCSDICISRCGSSHVCLCQTGFLFKNNRNDTCVPRKNCVQHRVNVLKRHKSATAKSIAWIRRMKQLNLHVAIKSNEFHLV